MKTTPELRVIALFTENIGLELTINQISKNIKKSYGFTNSIVNSMISRNIFNKKSVGPSILVSLNLKSPETTGWLVLFSAKKASEFLKNNKEIDEKITTIAKNAEIECVAVKNNILNVYTKNKSAAEFSLREVKDIVISDFEEIEDGFILFGFERFWRKMGEKHE